VIFVNKIIENSINYMPLCWHLIVLRDSDLRALRPQANNRKSQQRTRPPTVEEVTRALEIDILLGGLRPRERLVEDVLMQKFSTKRNVIRRALAELEKMGIVVRAPNKGASVRDLTPEEVEEITEIRETLHRRAVQRMDLLASSQLTARLRAIQHEHDKAIKARDARAIDEANERFHSTFFAACGNRLLSEAIGNYAYLSRIMRLYPLADADTLETVRREHWAIIEAVEEGDRSALTKLAVEHIRHSKRMYLRMHGSLPVDA
jgi:DNA-binding GntR family transcriptional regulator